MADPVTLSLAINVAMTAAMYAVTASQTIKGPRLSKDDRKVTLGDPGAPITRLWGTRWVTAQRIAAADLNETKKKTKGKGGKLQEYKYDGSWLDLFTDTPVDAITQIKMDGRLVYQRTQTGPITIPMLFGAQAPGAPVKLQNGKNFAVYLGDQTAPDPWYLQFTEDKTGLTNMAPAFLGETYARFSKIPLEKFGNRLPNVEAEIVRNKVDAYLSETFTAFAIEGSQMSPDGRFLISPGPFVDQYSVFDVATRTWIMRGVASTLGPYHIGDGGARWGVHGPVDGIAVQSLGGGTTVIRPDAGSGGPFLWTNFYAGGIHWFTTQGESNLLFASTGGSGLTEYDIGFDADWIFADLNGSIWAVGETGGTLSFKEINGAGAFSVLSPQTGGAYAFANAAGNFVVWQGGSLLLVDPVAEAILAERTGVAGSIEVSFRAIQPGASSIWLSIVEYSATDLSILHTLNAAGYGVGGFSVGGAVYSPMLDALIVTDFFSSWTKIFYLERYSRNGVELGDVISDVCTWSGIPAGAVDASACTQLVPGFSVQQNSGRSMLDPLVKIFDTIARPHDFSIEFKPRGDAPVGSLPMRRFVKSGKRYSLRKQAGNELPLDVTIVFADMTKEGQNNTAIADQAPEATGSDRHETIDLKTFADTPDGAQQKGDRYLRRQYNSREKLENTISVLDVAFEPGDVVTIGLSSLELNMLLEETTHRGAVAIDCQWSRDETAIAALNAFTVGAPSDGIVEQTIYIPAVTKGFAIDGPLFRDVDDDVNPQVFFAAGGFGSPWPGAATWRATAPSVYDELNATFDSSQAALFGFAASVLATANPWQWDRGNTLDVTLFGGTLTSYTEAEIEADTALNLVAIGAPGRWEYVQFASATLLGTSGISRSYRLQGFKRGRRGTESNVGNHALGDEILLYSAADVVVGEYGADELGNDMSFKTATVGFDPDFAASIDFTFAGNSLKPYAPVIWHVQKDAATGDLSFAIRTRTRIGGTWNGTAIPTGETIARYEFDVIDGTGAVLRTLASTDKSFTYAVADQVTDFGAEILAADLDGYAYQLGAIVGRGFAAAA